MENKLTVLRPGTEKSTLQLFVRWDKDHHDAGGTIELVRDGEEVVLSRPCYNNDRVYGYCAALVDLMRASGYHINMPYCLQGHIGPNRNRED